MAAVGCLLPLRKPLLTWSTSQSVLIAQLRPPPLQVQLQTHQTRSTAPTPQPLGSARRCRITTSPPEEDRAGPWSSSTTSGPAGAEQPGPRRKEDQDQDIGDRPESLMHQPILCLRWEDNHLRQIFFNIFFIFVLLCCPTVCFLSGLRFWAPAWGYVAK